MSPATAASLASYRARIAIDLLGTCRIAVKLLPYANDP